MTDAGTPAPLLGRTIAITADRRWREQAALFERRGARVLHAATMRSLDLRDDARLREVTEAVVASPPEVLIATTGQGIKWWLDASAVWGLDDQLIERLRGVEIIARGAKSASAVRGVGLGVAWSAPNESMAEVVEHLAARTSRPATMAVQLFDPDDASGAVAALTHLATSVTLIPLYRWELPDDTGPVVDLIDEVIAGRVDAVTFTSQPALRNLFRVAVESGRDGALRIALDERALAVCVGRVCAEAARQWGLRAVHWPEPPRLPAMVRLTTELLTARP